MIAARRQSLQTLDTLSPEPLPTVDPRYAPYLKSLQLREMQFHNFALPDQRVRYDKKSDAGNIFVLNLLTQEVL